MHLTLISSQKAASAFVDRVVHHFQTRWCRPCLPVDPMYIGAAIAPLLIHRTLIDVHRSGVCSSGDCSYFFYMFVRAPADSREAEGCITIANQ